MSMPPEPDHNLDASLRAYARKRREQAGDVRMHPAVRQRLHAEVRRQHPDGSSARPDRFWSRILTLGWPRLALAAALIAGVGVALVATFQQDQHIGVASSELAPAPASMNLADAKVSDERLRRDTFDNVAESPAASALRASQSNPSRAVDAPVSPPVSATTETDRRRFLSPGQPSAGGAGGEKPLDVGARPGTRMMRRATEPLPRDRMLDDAASVAAPAEVAKTERSKNGAAPAPGVAPDSLAVPAPAPPAAVMPPPRAPELAVSVTKDAAVGRESLDTALKEAEQLKLKTTSSQTGVVAATQVYFRNVSDAAVLKGGEQAATVQQNQLAPANLPAVQTGPYAVLTSFQVEQNGPSVRVIDADGSVYAGVLGDSAPMERLNGVKTDSDGANPPSALEDKARIAPASLVRFEAFGTNRTLNRSVALSGVLTLAPSVLLQEGTRRYQEAVTRGENQLGLQDPATLSAREQLYKKQIANAGQLSNLNAKYATGTVARPSISRLTGRAKVGGQVEEVVVDAVPQNP